MSMLVKENLGVFVDKPMLEEHMLKAFEDSVRNKTVTDVLGNPMQEEMAEAK